MRKERFYRFVILALLLLNLGVLVYLLRGNNGQDEQAARREPAGFIIERLQLDSQQQEVFDRLKHKHQRASRLLKDESKTLHDALFKTLVQQGTDKLLVDSLMKEIAENDAAKEQLNYEHFKELKMLLKPEQRKLYDEFIEDIARQFGPRQGPPPHRNDHPHH